MTSLSSLENFQFETSPYYNYENSSILKYENFTLPEVHSLSSDLPELTIRKFVSEKTISKETYKTYEKKINDRVSYLNKILDDDQDKDIFSLSQKTLQEFISCIKHTSMPLISVDNTGYLILEWRNYNNYDTVLMLFKANNQISLTGLKKKKCILKMTGVIEEISDMFLQM